MREKLQPEKLQTRKLFTQWFLMLVIHCQNNQEPKCWKTVNLFNFLLLKFCGNTKFPQNFQTRKVGQMTVLYALQNVEKSCLLFFSRGAAFSRILQILLLSKGFGRACSHKKRNLLLINGNKNYHKAGQVLQTAMSNFVIEILFCNALF